MKLYMKGGQHHAVIEIDGRQISIATEKTGMKLIDAVYMIRVTRGSDASREFSNHLETITETEMPDYIISEFEKMGYKLVKKTE